MPDCDYCGKSLGNEGARKNHESACDENPANQAEAQSPQPGHYDTAPPARAQAAPPAQPQQAQPPAPAQNQQQAIQRGAEFGEMFAAAANGDPEQKAQARGNLLQAVGAATARWGKEVAEQGVEDARRAKEVGEQGSLKKAETYPECPECGGQVTKVPEGQFPCPHCGAYLEPVPEQQANAEVEG